MLKEGQEHLLNNFFPVVSRNAKCQHITQKPVTKLVKKANNLPLDFRWARSNARRLRWPARTARTLNLAERRT